ncbi:MAG: hypothetical protein NW200_12735 [Hyphomonadaceae bacterium]|nr:hypothetical protein [Hyphomonadaceae bacterium]
MSQPAASPAPIFKALLDRVAADRRVSDAETLDLRRAVFADGDVDRAEAGALFDIAGRVANEDAAWAEAFVEAVGDHVLGPDRHITDDRAGWLIMHAPLAGALAAPLLVSALDRAESAPAALAAAARAAVLKAVADAPLDARAVAWVRTCLHAVAGDGAAHIGAEEAQWLFDLDAAVDGRPNDPAWSDLFVKAILNHVMGQRPSALLGRESRLARRAWLEAPVRPAPVGFLARAFAGGLDGWRARIAEPGEVDAFEAAYAERLAHAAEDAVLTLDEVTRLVALARADGKRTANEARLLEEVRRLEAAQAG